MRSPLADALAALAAALAPLRARWYLFGAQAALLYGAARLTADVDVTVLLSGAETATLVDALKKQGFRSRVTDTEEFLARTRVLPLVHSGSGMPVDLVLGGPGLEEEFVLRRRRRTIDGVRVFVAAPEDMVVMKILAARAKDEDDAVAMLAAQSRIDLRDIRRLLRRLEQALDRSDLLPRLEMLLQRARR